MVTNKYIAESVRKIARRYLQIKKLAIPIDVEALVRERASLYFLPFPEFAPIDGLCKDLKIPGVRPTVYVNSKHRKRRIRFTLAHELGHIVIPWHVGNISDEIDADQDVDFEHWHIESEANAFASEILMPHDFVSTTISLMRGPNGYCSIVDAIDIISRECDVSVHAAIIRVQEYIPKNHLLYVDSTYFQSLMKVESKETSVKTTRFSDFESVLTADLPNGVLHEAALGAYSFACWWFPNRIELPSFDQNASWREKLELCTSTFWGDEIERKKISHRINSILSFINSRLRQERDIEVIYATALQRFSTDEEFSALIDCLDFHEYLALRICELTRSR